MDPPAGAGFQGGQSELIHLDEIVGRLKDLKRRIAGTATAWVSRDGSVLFSDVPPGVSTETFAVMCATILGAAATGSSEFDHAPPEQIIIEGSDSKTVIVASGPKAFLVAVVDKSADVTNVLYEVGKVASGGSRRRTKRSLPAERCVAG